MKKKTKSHPIKLDPEEKELLASFEKGEWEPVRNEEREKKMARKMAARSLSKNIRINIRMSDTDLTNIKQMAAYEGLPYQTLISSVLHKYASGHMRSF